jgi:predicted transposase YbfD/YdcC
MYEGIVAIFRGIPDPRRGNAIVYDLAEVLIIAVLAILCGMECFVEMEMFGREREGWLRKFLKLEHGIPSHDTFGDVFAALDPHIFAVAFAKWVETIRKKISGEVVALDGKTIRASLDAFQKKKAVHIVSAWAASNRLVLGQFATEEKSNEITAIPQLLEMLELKGCIVTIDAMGTQTKIAEKIIDKGADYILSVKKNQETLHDDIALFFQTYASTPTDTARTIEKSHGRMEIRTCTVCKAIDWLDPEKKWKSLAGIAMLTSTNQKIGSDTVVTDTQYVIFSNPGFTAEQVLAAKRAHWGIENSLHWSLDVAYREDQCRVRQGHAAKVFNILRHLTMNLLRLENTSSYGISAKRRRCALSTQYLETVLRFS